MQLGSGSCRLKIFNLADKRASGLSHLKPFILVLSDLAESSISIRSCPGHIATGIFDKYDIDPQRTIYVEYYPPTTYGENKDRLIAERYDVVEFTWREGKAVESKWRPLAPPLLDMIKKLNEENR